MFAHIYSDRKDFSVMDVMHYAEAFLGYDYDGFTVIHVRISDFVKYPSVLVDVQSWIEKGRSTKKVVLLQNDLSQESIKKTLKGKIPAIYDHWIQRFDQTVKTNMVAI